MFQLVIHTAVVAFVADGDSVHTVCNTQPYECSQAEGNWVVMCLAA